MRKTLIGIIILLIFFSPLFTVYADPVEPTGSRTITGYKNLQSAAVPDSIYLVRIIDPNTLDVSESEKLEVPFDYRSRDYQAFSFFCYGTTWRHVLLSFTFNPMWLRGQSEGNDYIPYSVTMEHVSSLVSGAIVPINRSSVSTVPVKCSFLDYWFIYADQVQVSSGTNSDYTANDFTSNTVISESITNSAKTLFFKYSLEKYTKVQDVNGTTTTYSGVVCDYWNRNGTCTVNLDITPTGKKSDNTPYKNGTYLASVVVNIISLN